MIPTILKTQTTKKVILISTLLFGLNANSQITINNSDLPDGGDTCLVSKSNQFTNVDFNTTGANQTWDFSFLESNSQSIVDFFDVGSSSLLYQLSFNNAFTASDYKSDYYQNMLASAIPQIPGGAVTIENPVFFTKNTSSKNEAVGMGLEINGIEVPVKYDTIDVVLEFPMTYNDSWNSRSYFYLDVNPAYNAQLKRHQQRNVEVDGWGQITTPFGTFDAVRTKTTLTYQDSLFADPFGAGGAWFPLPSPQTVEYSWWTNNNKVPVLKISTQAGVATTIEYRDHVIIDYSGLDKNENLMINVYPNPTSNNLTINLLNDNNSRLEILDVNGKLIYSKNISKNHTLSVTNWVKGMYFIKVTNDNTVNTQSFIVE